MKDLLGGASLKALLTLGAFLALALWAALERDGRRDAELKLERCRVTVAEFRGAYEALAISVQDQARAIRQLEEEGKRRQAEAAAALERVRADAEAHRRSAERLRRMLLDPAELTCEEAVQRAKEAL